MKRGISSIISIVLMVLITIAVISIIYSGVNEIIRKEPEKFTSIQILTSGGNTLYDVEKGIASVVVKRGVDDAEIEKLQFIFYSSGTYIFKTFDVPEKNSQKVYYFNLTEYGIGKPNYVKVIPVLRQGKAAGIEGTFSEGSVTPKDFVPLINGQIYTDNILKNGDFEYGLQCFNFYPQKLGNQNLDFTVSLSTNSQSGKYSARMECTENYCLGGQEQMQAFIFNDYMPISAGQKYKVQFYARCSSGISAYPLITFYKIDTELHNYDSFGQRGKWSCNENWQFYEYEFDSMDGYDMMSFYINANVKESYINNQIGQFIEIDNIILTYADKNIPLVPAKNEGNSNPRIENGKFLVDGQAFFPLGIWNVPYSKLDEAKSLGANTVMSVSQFSSEDCFNTESYLDKVYGLGMKAIIDLSWTARATDDNELLTKSIDKFANHKSVIALEVDEPDHYTIERYQISADKLKEKYDFIKTKGIPFFANMYRTYIPQSESEESVINYEAGYKDAMDFWMIEPAVNYLYDLKTMKQRMDRLKQADPTKYTWVDLFPYVGSNYAETQLDLVERGYWAVINGGKGIVVDGYEIIMAKENERVPLIKQMFSELGQLKDVILIGENRDSSFIADNSDIGFIAREKDNKIYILAVNSDNTKNINVKFSSDLIKNKKIKVMFEGREINPTDDYFIDNFNGVKRHVYIIE